MRAVVYEQPGRYEVRDVPTPVPAAGDVRLTIERTGVCGTDLHIHDGTFFARFPLTPGHEIVGTVDAVGEGVTAPSPGERVVVNTNAACGACDLCVEGRPLLCRALLAIGVTRAGGFAESVVVPAPQCVPVGHLEPEVAVFAEPAACATHGIEVLDPRPGSSALVLGAGPTGLILAQLLMHNGASHVTVAEPLPFRVQIARRVGIDEVVEIPRDPAAAFAVLESTRSGGWDRVVVATAVPGVFEIAPPLTRDGGTVLWYGVAEPDDRVRVSPYDVYRREITIKGSFAQISSLPQAVAALEAGRIRTDRLTTHVFPLAEFGRALDTVRGDPSCLKAVVDPRLPVA